MLKYCRQNKKSIEVYKFIESLIYGENNNIEELGKELADIGVENFVENLKRKFKKPSKLKKVLINIKIVLICLFLFKIMKLSNFYFLKIFSLNMYELNFI